MSCFARENLIKAGIQDVFLPTSKMLVQYASSGEIDARVAVLEASLLFWKQFISKASNPMRSISFSVHHSSALTIQSRWVLNELTVKIKVLSRILELGFIRNLQSNPEILLGYSSIDDPLGEAMPNEAMLETLEVEWMKYYSLDFLKEHQIIVDGNLTLFNTPFTVWGKWQAEQMQIHNPSASHVGVIPISVLVVVDQGIVEHYGADYALKVKRNLELWDAPMTAYFGITLNVRAVLYIPDKYTNAEIQRRWLCLPANVACYWRGTWLPTRSLYDTVNYYIFSRHEQFRKVLGTSQWNSTIGASQNYDLLIVMGYHARSRDGHPSSGIAGFGSNWLFFALQHPFWTPQHMLLHELAHVFSGWHSDNGIEDLTIKVCLITPSIACITMVDTSFESIPDGSDGNGNWDDFTVNIGRFFVNFSPNADEIKIGMPSTVDWYVGPRGEFASKSILSYLDNFRLSWPLYNLDDLITKYAGASFVPVSIPKMRGSDNLLHDVYYDMHGIEGDFVVDEIASREKGYAVLVPTAVVYYPYVSPIESLKQTLSSFYLFDWNNWKTISENSEKFWNEDVDGDGVPSSIEWRLNLDPTKPDTDGDGLSDGAEDYDGDGLSNAFEVNDLGTDPAKSDTDDDGLTDDEEYYTYHTDPLSLDTDGDGLSDGKEIKQHHTDPLDPNTDDDYLDDGTEVAYRYDPLNTDDPIKLSYLLPTSMNADDRKDRITISFRGQAKVHSFLITLKLYERGLGGGWRIIETKSVITKGGTDLITITFTITREGFYTQARVLIKAYDVYKLTLGARWSSSYSIWMYVGGENGGGSVSPF